MIYLIDGHNLIGALPDIDLSDPHDEIKLIMRLRSWSAARKNRKALVIFDSGLPGGADKRLSSGPVKVVFAPNNLSADQLLMGRIDDVVNPLEYTLVTSDRRIIDRAKSRGMPYLTSEIFALRVGGSSGKASPYPESSTDAEDIEDTPQKPDASDLSTAEIDEWMELFGPEPETRLRRPKKKTNQKPSSSPEKEKESRRADELKDTGSILDPDEVAEWLRLFGNDS